MSAIEPLPQELETLSLEQQADAIVKAAEVRVDVLNRVMTVALKRTLPQDWVNFGGKPYLTAAGAERIRPLFRVEIVDVDTKRYEDKDDKGPYYYFVVTGTARSTYRIGGQDHEDRMSVMGTCSARDQFFATRWEDGADGKRMQVFLPASEVDPTNIVKAAYSNMVVNAVTRLVGIRNLTLEQLGKAGFDTSQLAKVEFKGRKGAAASPGRREGAAPQAPPAAGAESQSPLDRLRSLLATVTTDPSATAAYLRTLTSFDRRDGKGRFEGFDAFDAIARSRNPETVAQIAYDKLDTSIKNGTVKQTALKLGQQPEEAEQKP